MYIQTFGEKNMSQEQKEPALMFHAQFIKDLSLKILTLQTLLTLKQQLNQILALMSKPKRKI